MISNASTLSRHRGNTRFATQPLEFDLRLEESWPQLAEELGRAEADGDTGVKKLYLELRPRTPALRSAADRRYVEAALQQSL